MQAKVLVVVLACWISACNGPVVADSVPDVQKVAEACPADNFEEYLERFENDVEAQRRHTASPLQWDFVDACEVFLRPALKQMLGAAEIEYPVIPDSALQARDGLVREMTASNEEVQVKLSKPDTDYQVTYYFRTGACWTLYRKADDSL